MNQLSQEKAKPQQAPSIQEAEARERSAGAADQLVRLIALERQARRSETRQELAFTIVNWTHRLIPYYQAMFVRTSAAGRRAGMPRRCACGETKLPLPTRRSMKPSACSWP